MSSKRGLGKTINNTTVINGTITGALDVVELDFIGYSGTNIVKVPPNLTQALVIQDVAGNAYVTVNSTTGSPALVTGQELIPNHVVTPQQGLTSGSSVYSTGTMSQSDQTITGVDTLFNSRIAGGLAMWPDGTTSEISAVVSMTELSTINSVTQGSTNTNIRYNGVQITNNGNISAAAFNSVSGDITTLTGNVWGLQFDTATSAPATLFTTSNAQNVTFGYPGTTISVLGTLTIPRVAIR